MAKTPTIEDLLNALQNPETAGDLPNTAETWARIGNRDSFPELNMSSSELENFLKEWTENNPYSNI